jgi:hypothetical protein
MATPDYPRTDGAGQPIRAGGATIAVRRIPMRWLLVALTLVGCNPTERADLDTSTTIGEDCGNGVVAGTEVCDDGVNDGAYDGCLEDCSGRAAYCGDGEANGPEACDDGVNDGSYGSCSDDCLAFAPYCGDGEVNGDEVCDDGVNDGSYGSCTQDCTALQAFCGDGEVNGPEMCDDGINDGSCDSCAIDCLDYGSGLFLEEIVVLAVPDNYGWPAELSPDIFVDISEVDGDHLVTSDYVDATDPPVRFSFEDIEIDAAEIEVHVWDEDGGLFFDADDLGAVIIDTSMATGTVLNGETEVQWTIRELVCTP